MSVKQLSPRPLSPWIKEGMLELLRIQGCSSDFLSIDWSSSTDCWGASPSSMSTPFRLMNKLPVNSRMKSNKLFSGFNCFSRRNQVMRYITVEDLSFYYDKEPVLEHINYSVDSGEFVTLTGENGAAKTTFNQGQSWNPPTTHWQGDYFKDKYAG